MRRTALRSFIDKTRVDYGHLCDGMARKVLTLALLTCEVLAYNTSVHS